MQALGGEGFSSRSLTARSRPNCSIFQDRSVHVWDTSRPLQHVRLSLSAALFPHALPADNGEALLPQRQSAIQSRNEPNAGAQGETLRTNTMQIINSSILTILVVLSSGHLLCAEFSGIFLVTPPGNGVYSPASQTFGNWHVNGSGNVTVDTQNAPASVSLGTRAAGGIGYIFNGRDVFPMPGQTSTIEFSWENKFNAPVMMAFDMISSSSYNGRTFVLTNNNPMSPISSVGNTAAYSCKMMGGDTLRITTTSTGGPSVYYMPFSYFDGPSASSGATIQNLNYSVVPEPPNPQFLNIAPMSFLAFSNLTLGGVYQLQQSVAWYWSNQPIRFMATNAVYTETVAGVAGSGDYRLALDPVPAQAFAAALVDYGFVVHATVTSGGSGYVASPAVTIVGGGGTNATAAAHISGGVVTAVSSTDAGIGYTNTPTIRIAPPPTAAVSPTVSPVMRVDAARLAPYNNYQIQFKPALDGTWGNWSGGSFTPTGVTNSQYLFTQYLFITNSAGFFRLQYMP